ncbi:MAG TPA: UDP-N-acetylglucosamine 2-epimerase [Candidatus Paceibacterota bacterium]|nr:UDP-N-acetylglucosamine 2-epimerase [Candidatus Paceibacterota bacterium]
MSTEPIYFRKGLAEEIKNSGKKFVHIVAIATKPDIIKQYPVYRELKNRGEYVLLCHTGQHSDFRYSGGMEEEFGLEPDIRLSIEGDLHKKITQMIERFGEVVGYVKSAGKIPVPYIHGDTTTSMAIGLASFMHRVASVHVEAGIRTLTPKKEIYEKFYGDFKAGKFDWNEYHSAMRDKNNFERGSLEPFPEQYNTRVSDAASGFHAAPVEIDKEFLISEGFSPGRITVTGNTIVDSIANAITDSEKSTIFEKYPQLEGGDFIRFCIHRRENTQNKNRFIVLFDSIEKLLKSGHKILLISLFGTEEAINNFGLRSRLEQMVKDHQETFIYSDVWPYYRDVVAAMRKCALVATDSGSMQEETNIMGIPCVTLRFGSDRAESVIAGGNLLAPPIDSDFVAAIINGSFNNRESIKATNLYGENISKKIIDEVMARLEKHGDLFQTEEKRLGL